MPQIRRVCCRSKEFVALRRSPPEAPQVPGIRRAVLAVFATEPYMRVAGFMWLDMTNMAPSTDLCTQSQTKQHIW